MADLTHLDSATLTAFLDHDVAGFINDLKLLGQDAPDAPSLENIRAGVTTVKTEGMTGPDKPIAIGLMSEDTLYIGGASLTKATVAAIEDLCAILDKQGKLFQDIDSNLKATLTDLLGTQGANLTSIDGQDFLVDLSEVDSDFGQGAGGSGSGSGKGGGS